MQIKTIENFLSLKELSQKVRDLREFLQARAPYDSKISDKEERCLSEFYNVLQ